MEKPTRALQRRGVRYEELRSLDLNLFHPLGISQEQVDFLEAFMLFCLLQDSPPISGQEQAEIDRNLEQVAHRGRDPELQILRQGEGVSLTAWAEEICTGMQAICKELDRVGQRGGYSTALERQLDLVRDPELTPSARMLAIMRERGEGFSQFAQRMSLQHHSYFEELELDASREQVFVEEAERSRQQQRVMEESDEPPFAQFLQDYFAQ
jgi:glutamate--cysteine ligase